MDEPMAPARRHETPCGDGVMVWHAWGEGPPLLMLHGGSGSWTHWVRNIDTVVAAGRSAWVPDLPGFGDSASLGERADADTVVAPLADGLQRLAGGQAVDVAAFSFGSMVAVLLAAQQPARVAGLLLFGAPVMPLGSGKGIGLTPWKDLPPQEQAAAHRANLAALMLHRADSLDAETVALHAANVERDRMRRRRLVTTDAFGQALRRIRCSVDAVYGAEDVLYRGRWQEVEAALAACPGFGDLTLVPDAGHWVQYEEAEACNALLRGWL